MMWKTSMIISGFTNIKPVTEEDKKYIIFLSLK